MVNSASTWSLAWFLCSRLAQLYRRLFGGGDIWLRYLWILECFSFWLLLDVDWLLAQNKTPFKAHQTVYGKFVSSYYGWIKNSNAIFKCNTPIT